MLRRQQVKAQVAAAAAAAADTAAADWLPAVAAGCVLLLHDRLQSAVGAAAAVHSFF